MSTRLGAVTESWLRWKRAHEVVRAAVIADVVSATGLSEPELTVLVHLGEVGGVLRQSAIAAGAGWDRTRLSHLLTRMEARGHLTRRKVSGGVEVALLPPGQALLDDAQPRLQAAVREHLLDRLTEDDRRALERIHDALLS